MTMPRELNALLRKAKRLDDGCECSVCVLNRQLTTAVSDLRTVIETSLNYTGPHWPDEMTLREKLSYLYTGDINWHSLS